jgi:EmrB/QacA subfamily drug resistance transporter
MTTVTDHNAIAPPGRRRVLVVFGGVMLAMLLGALDQTIVATAVPTIVGDLGGLGHLSWVVTAYVLAATAGTPLWGKMGDLYGRKLFFQIAIAVFLAGSALSGLSQGMGELIAFRAFQGLGAGGLFALAWAIIGDVVAPRERGRYGGYLGAMFAVASVAGPLLGGFFAEELSWRWVFYVNLPIGMLALFAVSAGMPRVPRAKECEIDYPGAALLVAAVVSLLLVTTWGGEQYAWGSPQIGGLTVLGCGLLGAFVWRERRAPEPIVPLRLFRDPVFSVVSTTLFLATCSFFAVIVFMPLFLQVVTGAGATDSGLLLLPLMGGLIVSSTVSGHIITRTGRYKVFPVTGLALMTLGIVLLSLIDAHSSRITASLFMAVFGLGFGLVTQVLTLAIQNAVQRRDLGTATATANFFRSMGGAVGVAIFGAVFAGQLGGNFDPESLQSSPGKTRSLPPAVREGVVQAVSHGVHAVFLVAAPIAALGFVVVLFLKEYPLSGAVGGQPGNEDTRETTRATGE